MRPRLFGIAYRTLGSVPEAEDIVQDTWLRWHMTDRSVVQNAPAFLATITRRLSITRALSAHARHETQVAEGMPDTADAFSDPALEAERADALTHGIWTLLEKLTPAQRASYILREAFRYDYAEIGAILRITPDTARQLVSRGRRQLHEGQRRQQVSRPEHVRLLETLSAASRSGDLERLEALFAGMGRP